MHRTQCVLALLSLYAGVVQSFFSWDIVVSRDNRLEFYNEGTFIYVAYPTSNIISWINYDPLHNRVLFKDTVAKAISSFDIKTGKAQTLINLKPYSWSLVYDPARELLFASIVIKGKTSIKSFHVKPGSDAEVEGNHMINLTLSTNNLAVDSCRGYIYWTTNRNCTIEKVQINASESEAIKDGCTKLIKTAMTIDPQTQKIYWAEKQNDNTVFLNADLDGSNKKTLYKREMEVPIQISVSKDFIYWVDPDEPFFWQLPKNTSLDIDADVKPQRFALDNVTTNSHNSAIASKYAIEEQTEGNPDCKALQSLLPSIPVKPESPVNDTVNISVCQNYCLQGHCSVNADGKPNCRCDGSYSGARCEVDECRGYCLHEGVCSLNEKRQPVCRCSKDYEGDRCDVSVFLSKFFQQFVNKTTSMLNEIIKKMELLSAKETST